MSNPYYSPSGSPSTGAQALSSTMRSEFALIQAGFDLLPTLSGNGSKIVAVNSGGTALTVVASTGSGSVVRATSPTLVTPNIGAASGSTLSLSGQLTSTVADGTAPFVVTSTTEVANLKAESAGNADTVTTNADLTGPITSSGNTTSVADQTGTGTTFVMQDSPSLTTPTLGVATATSINKVTITAPASSATLTIADGKTLTVSKTLTFDGTDSKTHTFPSTDSTVARTDAGQTFTGTQVFGTIDVNGGAIDGATIGASSAAAGTFTRVAESLNSYSPSSGASQAIDWANGGSKLTNSGTNTISFSNVPSGTSGHILYCSNLNNTTFPAAVDWGVAGKPSISGGALVSLVTLDGGTTVYACLMWQAS